MLLVLPVLTDVDVDVAVDDARLTWILDCGTKADVVGTAAMESRMGMDDVNFIFYSREREYRFMCSFIFVAECVVFVENPGI